MLLAEKIKLAQKRFLKVDMMRAKLLEWGIQVTAVNTTGLNETQGDTQALKDEENKLSAYDVVIVARNSLCTHKS